MDTYLDVEVELMMTGNCHFFIPVVGPPAASVAAAVAVAEDADAVDIMR